VVAALFCSSHAYAALPDEIQVYTDDVNAPGERGIELHVNATPSGRSAPGYPGEVPPHHGLRITPEISWGLARNWDGAFTCRSCAAARGPITSPGRGFG
jgi:hypothetical protein